MGAPLCSISGVVVWVCGDGEECAVGIFEFNYLVVTIGLLGRVGTGASICSRVLCV